LEAAVEEQEEAEPIDTQDQRFARRLKDRDHSVLVEIQQAYEEQILGLLTRRLQSQDAATAFNEALLNLWHKYAPERGATVRGFLSGVARRRMIDLIRARTREKKKVNAILQSAEAEELVHPGQPEDAILSREEQAEVSEKLQEVEKACEKLTPLQKQAFKRRFLEKTGTNWAKELEEETEISAKAWRKHSASALKRVRKLVADSSAKGVRNEVA